MADYFKIPTVDSSDGSTQRPAASKGWNEVVWTWKAEKMIRSSPEYLVTDDPLAALEGEPEPKKNRAGALAELTAENLCLRERISDLEKLLGDRDKMLPAISNTQLATVEEEKQFLQVGLEKAHSDLGSARAALSEMEFERDERDSLLRAEEGRRQQAQRREQLASEQLALVRAQAIISGDPLTGKTDAEGMARTRMLAALGNMGAKVALGGDYLDHTCAFCRSSPACTKERLLVWPHGNLVPRRIQEYIKLLVQEAQDKGADPFAVLEAYASGVSGEELDIDSLRASVPGGEQDHHPFSERATEQLERKQGERTVAVELRSIRCEECSTPLLWHSDGPVEKRSDDVCALSQEAVYERSKAIKLTPTDPLSELEVNQ